MSPIFTHLGGFRDLGTFKDWVLFYILGSAPLDVYSTQQECLSSVQDSTTQGQAPEGHVTGKALQDSLRLLCEGWVQFILAYKIFFKWI